MGHFFKKPEVPVDRQPVVSGKFYPDSPDELARDVAAYLKTERASAEDDKPHLAAMVPHAGYIYSGRVCGRTLGAASLGETVVLLGPNHTGRGAQLALWDRGKWLFPGGSLSVDEEFADAVAEHVTGVRRDTVAHRHEHSLEVIVPFLHAVNPETKIVPFSVSLQDYDSLFDAAQEMAAVIRAWERPVTLVVSSDMNHFLPHDATKRIDSLAIERILALDPEGLYRTVREHHITMCGVLPMTLALAVSLELGAGSAELVDYATSGDAGGDMKQVVGYAGVLIR